MGDLNNDELMDLIVGTSIGKIFYYLNTGSKKTAMFTAQKDLLNGFDIGCNDGEVSPFLADLNTDGLMDLIVGCGDIVLYFSNTGTNTNPVFTIRTGGSNPFENIKAVGATAASLAPTASPSLVDLNFDSKLDLVLGTATGKIQYYINTGTLPIHSAFIGQKFKLFIGNLKAHLSPPLFVCFNSFTYLQALIPIQLLLSSLILQIHSMTLMWGSMLHLHLWV